MDEYIKFSGKSIKDASNHLFGSLLLLSILLRPFSKLCLRCRSFAVGFNRRSEASTPEIEMVTSVRLSLLLWFSALTWMLCTYVSTIIALVFSLNLDAMYICIYNHCTGSFLVSSFSGFFSSFVQTPIG